MLDSRLWWFDQNLLVLKDCAGGEQSSHLVLDKAAFWVHIYDLLFNSLDEDIVRVVISESVTKFDREDYGWYVSIRVEINTRNL